MRYSDIKQSVSKAALSLYEHFLDLLQECWVNQYIGLLEGFVPVTDDKI
jgi:hypothetical protein